MMFDARPLPAIIITGISRLSLSVTALKIGGPPSNTKYTVGISPTIFSSAVNKKRLFQYTVNYYLTLRATNQSFTLNYNIITL